MARRYPITDRTDAAQGWDTGKGERRLAISFPNSLFYAIKRAATLRRKPMAVIVREHMEHSLKMSERHLARIETKSRRKVVRV